MKTLYNKLTNHQPTNQPRQNLEVGKFARSLGSVLFWTAGIPEFRKSLGSQSLEVLNGGIRKERRNTTNAATQQRAMSLPPRHRRCSSRCRSFVPSFLRCFVPSLLRCFVASFLRSFVPSFVRSFVVPSFIRSFVHSFIRSFVHSFIRSFVHSFIRSFVPSF